MRTCATEGCEASIEGRHRLTKICLDCSAAKARARKAAKLEAVRAAYAESKLAQPVGELRTCCFPGCPTQFMATHWNHRWCAPCKAKMQSSRALRREGAQARVASTAGKQRDAALWANQRRTPQPNSVDLAHPREKQKMCFECGNMPWARTRTRFNSRSGDSAANGPPVADERGLCRGCGLPWAPEPKPELCGTIRSSGALAAEHGALYGGHRDWRGRSPVGRTRSGK